MRITGAHTANWGRWSYWALWFNAFWAAAGSWYLLGDAEPMSLDYLETSPFSDYTIPGFTLLFAVGGSSLLAAIARWRGWQHRYLLTIVAGAILFGWIFFEFLWIPEGWAAQLLFAALAAIIVAGGIDGRHGHAS